MPLSLSPSLARRRPLGINWRAAVMIAALILAGGIALGAQPQHAGSVSAEDLAAGAALYSAQCSACHGASGSQVPGVDLASGEFRARSSDETLARTIAEGVPGTAMRAHRFTPTEMSALIAYVRTMGDAAASPAPASLGDGNAAAGKAFVDGEGRCLSCHRIDGTGARRAADLSDIGATRTPAAIDAALAAPQTRVAPARRFIRAVTADGRLITGRRMNEDSFTVQLLDDGDRLVSLVKAELREYSVSTALDPPAHTIPLTDLQRRDVVSYLLSLQGMDPAAARGGRP